MFAFGSQVRVAIVDAWSSVLNDREKERKPKDPILFFSSTWTTILISVVILFTLHTILCISTQTQTVVETSNNKEERCQWFGDHLREDYVIPPHRFWETITMITFVPVGILVLFYMVFICRL